MAKYPELRKLMAARSPKPMTKLELAKLIGKTPGVVTEKMDGRIDFKWSEVRIITDYFRGFNSELSSDIIFSDVEVVTIVNKTA